MKGILSIRMKENNREVLRVTPWQIVHQLNYVSVFKIDINEIRVFVDDEEIPKPEGSSHDR